jgi:hypothetical protein
LSFFALAIVMLMPYATIAKALASKGLLPNFVAEFQTPLMQIAATIGAVTFSIYRACRLPTVSHILSSDSRPPFVYLRSFRDEKRYRMISSWRIGGSWQRYMSLIGTPFETILAMAAADKGPFIALAKPGRLTLLDGAARESAAEDWKSHVISFLKKARAVIILPGMTGGLAWELSWLHDENMLGKSAFVIPPVILRYHRRKLWRTFCSATQIDHMLQMPPEDEVLKSLILYIKNESVVSIKGKRNELGYRTAITRFIEDLPTLPQSG